ncbi:MAG: tRNA 2-thiouridine(34) synthase MnmA [bacterium]
MKKKVFVGLSGGVDSATTAYLLSKDYSVTGVHIRNLETDNSMAAKTVAEQLRIPFLVWDMREEFEKEIISMFKNGLKQGITPNPCVFCNEKIKFGRFFTECLKEGADYISTGHYARVEDGKLLRGKDDTKDQSYFLYRIRKEILNKTIFPLGEKTKKEVRIIAQKVGLKAAKSKESQDICFIENSNIREFIRKNINENPGIIVDYDTKKEVGKHLGLQFYTLGQREGIKIGGTEKPYFVVDKDVEKNILFVGQGKDHTMLWKKEIKISYETWISEKPEINKVYLCQIRYGQPPVTCKYYPEKVTLDELVYAPTTGQSLVIYDGDEVVGGGIIT